MKGTRLDEQDFRPVYQMRSRVPSWWITFTTDGNYN